MATRVHAECNRIHPDAATLQTAARNTRTYSLRASGASAAAAAAAMAAATLAATVCGVGGHGDAKPCASGYWDARRGCATNKPTSLTVLSTRGFSLVESSAPT